MCKRVEMSATADLFFGGGGRREKRKREQVHTRSRIVSNNRELNQGKNWHDLLTEEPFKREDIITIQDPMNPEKNNFANFYYIKKGLSVKKKADSSSSTVRAGNSETHAILVSLRASVPLCLCVCLCVCVSVSLCLCGSLCPQSPFSLPLALCLFSPPAPRLRWPSRTRLPRRASIRRC